MVAFATLGLFAAVVAGSVNASPHPNPHHFQLGKRHQEQAKREPVPAPNGTHGESGHSLAKRDYSGIATFYDANGGTGACGWSIQNSDWSVALKGSMFDPSGGYGGGSKWCGVKIVITANGKTATATIADACPGCQGDAGIDMTPDLFSHFIDQSAGVVPVTWVVAGQGGGDSSPPKQTWQAPTTTTTQWTPQWTPTSTWTPWTPQYTPTTTKQQQQAPAWTPNTPTTQQAQWTPTTSNTPKPPTTTSIKPTTVAPSSLPPAAGVWNAANLSLSLLPGMTVTLLPITLPDGTLANVTSTIPISSPQASNNVTFRTNVTTPEIASPLNVTMSNSTVPTLSSGQTFVLGNLGRSAQIVIDIANMIVKAANA